MPASWELQLIASVVRAPDPGILFTQAVRAGVRVATMGGDEAKLIWARLALWHDRVENFGRVPSEQSLREWFPATELPVPVEDFHDLCVKVMEGHVRRETARYLAEFNDLMHEDPRVAVETLHGKLGLLQEGARASTDRDFGAVAMNELLTRLDGARNVHGITGLPWPWPNMNQDTQGIHPGDFIMVWALPKSMKTYFGLVVSAHLYQLGYRVLVYSKEMTWEALRDRIACLLAHANYSDFRKGRLTTSQKCSILECVEALDNTSHRGRLFFTQADRMDGGPGGPQEIRRKIDAYQPDFVLLDSSYMLEIPNNKDSALDWKSLAMITRALKQVAKTATVPIMAILQESERQALKYAGKSRGTASLAYNTSAPADCDLGLRLVLNKRVHQLSVIYAVAREIEADGFSINAVPCTDFLYAGPHVWEVGDDQGDDVAQTPPAAPTAQQVVAGYRANTPAPPLRLVLPPAPDEIAMEIARQEPGGRG